MTRPNLLGLLKTLAGGDREQVEIETRLDVTDPLNGQDLSRSLQSTADLMSIALKLVARGVLALRPVNGMFAPGKLPLHLVHSISRTIQSL